MIILQILLCMFLLDISFFVSASYLLFKPFEAPKIERLNVENKQEGKDPLPKSSSERLTSRDIASRAIQENLRKTNSEKNINPKIESKDVSSQKIENKSLFDAKSDQKNQSLDLTNDVNQKKPSSIKSYTIMTPEKIASQQPIKGYEQGIPIRYNERMVEPIHNYVNVLKNAPENFNVVKNVPEIFTTYALEFIDTQPYLFQQYNSKTMMQVSFNWTNTITKSVDLANLYQGIKFLETIDFSKNYNQARFSNNPFMAVDMDVYVQALRSEYMHVPDAILETYVTEYLKDPANQRYEQKKVHKEGVLWNTTQLVNDKDKPMPVTPEDILLATKNIEFKIPIVNGDIDVVNLKDYQKLYLTIKAIENINKKHPKEYQQEISRDGLQIKEDKNFEHDKLAAMQRAGDSRHFLLKFGINDKKIDQISSIDQSKIVNLAENYPSFKAAMDNPQDTMAFEQLQLDFIELNQDILAVKTQIISIKDQSSKAILNELLKKAGDLKNSMNQLIVERKVIDFITSSSFNIEEDIAQALLFLENKGRSTQSNGSEIQKILYEQEELIIQEIKSQLQAIQSSIKSLKLPELTEKQLIALIKEKEALNNKNLEDTVVINQLQRTLLNLKIKNQALLKDMLKKSLSDFKSSVGGDYDAYKEVIPNILNQLVNDSTIPVDIRKDIRKVLQEYNKDFQYQDIGNITDKLNQLILTYPNIEKLQLYNKLIIELNLELEPLQFEIRNNIKLDAQVDFFVNQILNDGNNIENAIKKIENVQTSLKSKNNITSSDKQQLNTYLKNISEDDFPSEYIEYNKSQSFNNNLSSFDIQGKENIDTICTKILEKLKEKQKEQLEKSSLYQLRTNLWNSLENVWSANFNKAGSQAVYAVSSVPGALVETNSVLTQYVHSVLGKPLLATLSAGAAAAIVGCIQQYAPLLLQIGQSNLSDEDKNKLKQEALQAMLNDIGNIVVADQTGASLDVVAGGDAQAIATSSIFNKAIQSLVPDDPSVGYSYDNSISSPGYVDNRTKFQQKYSSILTNQPLNQYSSHYVSN